MDVTEAMRELEAAGREATRRTYARHGVRGDVFGVSYADLGKLKKRIGVDHELALALWATGNHDARVLATMVADPERMERATLDRWAADADSYPLVDALAVVAARGAAGRARAERWRAARGEWAAALGWTVLGMELRDRRPRAEEELLALLADVEARIATAPNRARLAMLNALIAIGGQGGALERAALAAAKRIGPVEVDHGDTDCKTPDPIAYITKMAARRGSGAPAKAKAKASAKAAKPAKPSKAAKTAKATKPAKSAKSAQATQAKGSKPAKSAKASKAAKPAKPAIAAKSAQAKA